MQVKRFACMKIGGEGENCSCECGRIRRIDWEKGEFEGAGSRQLRDVDSKLLGP